MAFSVIQPGLSIDRVPLRDPDVASLGPAWEELCREVEAPAVADPTFLRLWCQHRLGANEEASLLVARVGGQLVGILPLLTGEIRVSGMVLRTLWHPGRNAYVPGVTALLAPAQDRSDFRPERVAVALAEAACDVPDWDLMQWNSLESGSLFLAAMREVCGRRGMLWDLREGESSATVDLSGGWDGVLAAANARRARLVRKLDLRLGAAGFGFREVRDAAEVEAALHQTFVVAQRSWQGERGSSIVSRGGARPFYDALTREMAGRGRLSLCLLSAGETPVSFLLNLEVGPRVYGLKTGYVPERREDSPGVLVHAHAFRVAIERGARSLELFHPASEDKQRWGVTCQPRLSMRVFAPTLKGRMLATAQRVKRMVG